MQNRLIAALVVLLLWCVPSQAQIAHRQSEPGVITNSASSTVATAFGSDILAGSLLVACVPYYNPAGTISVSSIADTRSSTWAKAYGPVTVTSIGGDWSLEVWRAYNSTAGANTVTVTYSASVAEGRGVAVTEVTGAATSNAQDQSMGRAMVDPGTVADAVTSDPTGTTSQANELVYGCTNVLPYDTVTEGSGFTTLGNTSNSGTYNRMAIEYKTVSATSTYAATFTSTDVNSDASTIVVTFKEAGGGGAASPRGQMIGVLP